MGRILTECAVDDLQHGTNQSKRAVAIMPGVVLQNQPLLQLNVQTCLCVHISWTTSISADVSREHHALGVEQPRIEMRRYTYN
jgi:hypothetical protein